MAAKVLVLVLTVLVFYGVECKNDPPVVNGSFIAWGEIVQPVPDTDDLIILQISFEESFKADTQDAAFFLWFGGKNLTFVKNHKLNQTFFYIEEKEKEMECVETSEREWIESDFESSLLSFEDDDGTVRFSLNQLFSIPNKYLTDKLRGVSTTFRGIPAYSWTYEVNGKDAESGNVTTLTITSYWSNGTWETSAGRTITPLGFNVSRIIWFKPKPVVESYSISVFGFIPNAYDHKYFEPYEGIICANRVKTLKFPNVKDLKAISLHSELALPDYQELRYVDHWFDPVNQLVRVDVERMVNEDPLERKMKKYQSEIAVGKMNVVYRFGYFKGESSCQVIPFKSYVNDLQNLFDIKQDLNRWKMGKLFGLNDTSYVYIGKTTKNDIPCHLFQGIRTDWPDKDSKIQSLWEWCFNVNMTNVKDIVMFQDDEFGLISAQITILSHPNPNFKNYRMFHHFYEVQAQEPKILDATSFDIGRCFNDLQKKPLQFYLDVLIGNDNKTLADNASADINFLQKWKSVIYQNSGLPMESLRISNVRATVDDNKIFIKFNILDIHKDLPADIKEKQISSSDAEKKLRDNINGGKVAIKHEWKKGVILTFNAVKSSLSYQIDPDFKPQTVTPSPSTTPVEPTLYPFTLQPDDTTKPQVDSAKHGGHQPGAVAGVSIAMLLIGITIGSSATFYKFNGLPSCLRRS